MSKLFIYSTIHMDLIKASTMLLAGLRTEVIKTQQVWILALSHTLWTLGNEPVLTQHPLGGHFSYMLYSTPNETPLSPLLWSTQINAPDSTSVASTALCLFADRNLKWWLKNPTQGYCCRKLLLATICSSSRFFFFFLKPTLRTHQKIGQVSLMSNLF